MRGSFIRIIMSSIRLMLGRRGFFFEDLFVVRVGFFFRFLAREFGEGVGDWDWDWEWDGRGILG
jgi:hypothetical protein